MYAYIWNMELALSLHRPALADETDQKMHSETAEDTPNRMPWKSRTALIQNDYLNHAVYEVVAGSGVRGGVQRKSKNWHIERVHAS